jgi:hypothetical protein
LKKSAGFSVQKVETSTMYLKHHHILQNLGVPCATPKPNTNPFMYTAADGQKLLTIT